MTTNELASAGTTAQVTLTVYGHKGQTTPLPLGFGDGQHFQNGHIDEFDVRLCNYSWKISEYFMLIVEKKKKKSCQPRK